MKASQARDISIAEFLQYEGKKPVRSRLSGKELWYHSPIRSGDENPSFKIDSEKNLWFDHGASQGGDLIKLVCELRNTSVSGALSYLESTGLYKGPNLSSRNYSIYDTSLSETSYSKNSGVASEKGKVSSFSINSVKEISSPALIQYLDTRKISLSLATKYLKEISYSHSEKRIQYFGLGFSSGNGYEVRNILFKGFVGTQKQPTWINCQENSTLSVFEGIFDYLAFLENQGKDGLENSVLILNSTNLKRMGLDMIKKVRFKKIYFFLDNDDAGENTFDFFTEVLPDYDLINKSSLYANFKDFNEMWINR